MWLFAAAFFLWQALSVPWALHMREMRYYSLVCLLLAWLLYLAVRRHTGRMGTWRYAALTTAALVLLLTTFPVAMAGAAAALGLWEVVLFTRTGNLKKAAAGIVPLAAAGAAAGVYAVVFRSIPIAAGFAEMFPRTPEKTWYEAGKIFAFFRDYESLWVIAAALGLGTVVAAVSWLQARRRGNWETNDRPSAGPDERSRKAEIPDGGETAGRPGGPAPSKRRGGLPLMSRADRGLVGLSVIIAAYAMMHTVAILQPSFPRMFNRYYIWLQPAAGLALWLDLFALGGTLKSVPWKWARGAARAGLAAGFVLLAALTAGERAPVLRERVYELFHRYVGPMDYAVGFIQRRYPDPSRILVATNYEEPVLEYYLGSRVIVGYTGNNLEEDMKLEPDVIVTRNRASFTNRYIRELVERTRYKRKIFWIVDTPTNTVPEVSPSDVSHRYRTPRTRSEELALRILYK